MLTLRNRNTPIYFLVIHFGMHMATVISPSAFGSQDVLQFAHDISIKSIGEKEWKEFAKKIDAQFDTWQNDNPSGERKRGGFINISGNEIED